MATPELEHLGKQHRSVWEMSVSCAWKYKCEKSKVLFSFPPDRLQFVKRARERGWGWITSFTTDKWQAWRITDISFSEIKPGYLLMFVPGCPPSERYQSTCFTLVSDIKTGMLLQFVAGTASHPSPINQRVYHTHLAGLECDTERSCFWFFLK